MSEIGNLIEFLLIIGGIAYWVDMLIEIRKIITNKGVDKE